MSPTPFSERLSQNKRFFRLLYHFYVKKSNNLDQLNNKICLFQWRSAKIIAKYNLLELESPMSDKIKTISLINETKLNIVDIYNCLDCQNIVYYHRKREEFQIKFQSLIHDIKSYVFCKQFLVTGFYCILYLCLSIVFLKVLVLIFVYFSFLFESTVLFCLIELLLNINLMDLIETKISSNIIKNIINSIVNKFSGVNVRQMIILIYVRIRIMYHSIVSVEYKQNFLFSQKLMV